MLVLAIDTTETTASVALTNDYKLLAEYKLNSKNTHSETILPMIEDILSKLGYKVSDIDLMACAIGPGSFTGLRIGAATIKGLAMPFNTPCVGVSSLYALAKQFDTYSNSIICPLVNARRGQYYTAIYKVTSKGKLKELLPDSILLVDEIKEMMSKYKNVYFTGSGHDDFVNIVNCKKTPEVLKYESAYAVAIAGLEKYNLAKSKKQFTGEKLNPVYLRKAQAERELEEKLAKGEK